MLFLFFESRELRLRVPEAVPAPLLGPGLVTSPRVAVAIPPVVPTVGVPFPNPRDPMVKVSTDPAPGHPNSKHRTPRSTILSHLCHLGTFLSASMHGLLPAVR